MSSSSSGRFNAAALLFWGFLGVKAFGHAFALWSWWWVLLPIVPWLFVIVGLVGL